MLVFRTKSNVRCVTMLRQITKVLVLILLMNQVANIFGKLTTLSGPTFSEKKKVICLSENDGGALVWNADLKFTYYTSMYIIDPNAKDFYGTCTLYGSQVDCKLNVENDCLNSWERKYWSVTNSIDTPMGPVFDNRWEEFEENSYAAKTLYHIEQSNTNTIVLPFSIRATKDVHVLICNQEYKKNLCYWVIIGGWGNTKSVIRKCSKGVPNIGVYPAKNDPECAMERDYLNHTALAEYEWRTFILTWNSETRTISLYDSDQLIVTYTDTDIYTNTKFTSKLYIRSALSMLVRYHDYNYLYTSNKNAILTSNIFYMSTENLCLQMLIGLCAQCDADISLHTSTNKILKTITVKGSSVAAVHGLPVWQPVKINDITTYIYNGLKIVVTPKLNRDIFNPMWAIANIRRCPSDGCLRESSMYIHQDWNSTTGYYFWPNVTCQKLFYKEQSVVLLFNNANLNVELDDKNCSAGYVGPACKYHCESVLDGVNCKNVLICNDNGCTCTSGYRGTECNIPCDNNFYGHACKNKCGSCLQGKQCDPISGVCSNGCRNTENYIYAPPLCQIGIGKPSKTEFTFTNQTAIVATVQVKWEKEYEGLNLFYKFNIKKPHETYVRPYDWKRIPPNSTKLEQIFENLEHGAKYSIQCVLVINESPIYGDWKTADTHCDSIKNFNVTFDETSLTIMQESENQLYPCPMNSYILIFKNNDNQQEKIIRGSIPSFPYTLTNLTPYTSYNVTILNRNTKLFSEEIRTLEGVPSKVLSLQALPLSSTNFSLFWVSPRQTNGVIKEYEIQLTVAEYFGCKNVAPPPSSKYILVEKTNNMEITFSGLHAYAKYNVQVTAYNSRHSSIPEWTTFDLPAAAVPVVTFSQVKFEDWILSWKPPEDCTAILGPLTTARIEILGISDSVKNFNVTKNTNYDSINLRNLLYGAEHYVAKIFALRGYDKPINTSAYKEYEFETLPKAPPNVIDLEIVEVQNYETIHLRWQSPLPPLNGVLRGYGIIICPYSVHRSTLCKVIEVELNETCDLWDNYICKSIPYTTGEIKVAAYNIGVNQSSSVNVIKAMLNNARPDTPRNVTFTIGNNSVVDLQWLHPWRTGRHLLQFTITINKVVSDLSSFVRPFIGNSSHQLVVTVTNYTRSYNVQLHLLPSTQYEISILSMTTESMTSNMAVLNFWTPSTVNFKGNLTSEVYEFDSTIAVHIPQIVNDTRNSMLYIIVNGPHHDCNNYVQPYKELWKQAGVQMYDIFWQAAAISTHSISDGTTFILGNGDIYGNATNCPLVSGELYDITIVISEPNLHFNQQSIMITRKISTRIGVKQNHPEFWLIPLLMIIFAATAAFYFFRRRRQKPNEPLRLRLRDEMALSQNIESYVNDTKVMVEEFKKAPSTPSDRQSLSRATTPDVTTIADESNDEEEEVVSSVKVKDFEDYVRQAIASGLLNKQYETFPRGQTQPWDYGKQPQNKTKNRYGNLIAYDETRVILKKLPNDAHSDYINANYITGYKKKKRYIATQGPKPNTVVDFWRMIWQEKVLIICMLANVVENGKTKCEQYWPDIGKKKKYGEIIVLNATHNVFADYCFRTLHVIYGDETRKVEHLHYTAWPDHGVPMYTHSVVTYLKKLLAIPPGDGPVVVHCSAGVGRTGTIVLCDICLHRAAAEGVVDVFAETASIRRERANMVDNKQQYLLAHLALVECLLIVPTTLPCNEILPTRIKELKKQLLVQQQRLQDTAWQDEALRPVTTPPSLSELNRAKNRFPELISDKASRIYLSRYPSSDEDSDYLSAVYVDGVKLQNQYLATQLPMPSTINDFWRMIAEFKVELIVMLQPPDPKDSTCCAIAPTSGEFKPTPYLNITAKEIVELENYTLQKLLLVNNSEKPSREQFVTILCCTEWKPGRNQPPPPVMTLVTFWQATERIARGDGPTVTLCHDGVTGCGLYLALSFMLERMAVERECDICLAVRAVRRSRPDFVRSLEHLEYLYDAAITYLEYFETYANFS